MSVYSALEQFVRQHRRCGELIGDAGEPMPGGYRIWVSCPCGASFARWVTPEEAELDLASTS
jgi:hypothetical protein